MSDLWDDPARSEQRSRGRHDEPLAQRLRPRTLAEVRGQSHLLAEGKLLRRVIEADLFHALLLCGPPGTGKTTLAQVIARETTARFETLNATTANSATLREHLQRAQSQWRLHGARTILFVDEIHRFAKNQQDILLPHLEEGAVRFIGATTENPSFSLNNALLSRAQVFQLSVLSEHELLEVVQSALHDERSFPDLKITMSAEAKEHLVTRSEGDARKCLSALELAVLSSLPAKNQSVHLDLAVIEDSVQQKRVYYDRNGDQHYDTASALIKSIRGSDPDAALYWLAKMLHGGEDPRFIARRLIISTSEDIGLADSNALRVALSAQQALEFLGMPEGRIPLAHATVHLATAPKSNSAYAGLNQALEEVKEGVTLAVPPHLQTSTQKKRAADQGMTKEQLKYHYSHDAPENYVPQSYLPEGRVYYTPTCNGMEKRIAERLEHWRTVKGKVK